MKILLDPQIFVNQKIGGVPRQFVEVWQRLKTYPDVEIISPIIFSENYHLSSSKLRLKTPLNLLQNKKFKGAGKAKELFNHVTLYSTKKLLTSRRFDIFLPTYYDSYFSESLNDTPILLSVFDMIHELFPQYFPGNDKTISQKKALLYKAARIIVHSNQTKNDIIKFYPDLDAGNIDLVPLASLNMKFESDINRKSAILPHPYLLFVGTRDKYKNFLFFLNAVKSLLVANKLHLVCIGGGPFSDIELRRINEFGLNQMILQKNLSDNELPSVYKNALAFVFPSEYEGFGMPVLEAMACGCPVILADNGTLREVGGDAALYFKLNSKEELRCCIIKLLQDDSLRMSLIEKGRAREKLFSWDLTARGYYDAILKVLNPKI